MSQQLTFDLSVDNSAAISSINTFFDAWDAGVKNAGQILDKQFGDKNKVIGIKLEGGKVIAQEMDNIYSTGNKITKATKVLNGEFGKTPAELRKTIGVLKEAIGNTRKYKEGTKEVTEDWKQLVRLLREAKGEMKDMKIDPQMEKSITGANIAAGLALDAIRALGAAVIGFIKEGMEMEVLMLQLEGFTGSVEAAEEAFAQFVRIAVDTPFNVKQVSEAGRTMMGFGVTTDETIKRVRQLAIVASSTGGDLKMMARNLGQIQANQKAYTRDLMQFANQGIPIYEMLGKVLGRSTEQIRQMATEGTIGFAEVTAALDLMTQKGSAYQVIAEKMGRTFLARFEEIASAITETSGRYINFVQAIDASLGGPIEKAMQLIANIIGKIGQLFTLLAKNADTLAPIFAAVGTALAAAMGIAAIQNIKSIADSMLLVITKVKLLTAVTWTLNVAQKVYAALTGNFAAIALAAGIAAAATYGIKKSMTETAPEVEALSDRIAKQEGVSIATADANKLLAFSLKDVTGANRDLIKEEKKRFKDLQQKYQMAISEMDRALAFIQREGELKKTHHEDEMRNIKEKIQSEKQGMNDALNKAKEVHNAKMTDLKEELNAVRSRYDEELALLDEESIYARELRAIRKQEIIDKLNSTELSRKEKLELMEQLEQMGRQEKRRDLLAKKAEEEKAIEEKITEQQEAQVKKLDDIKNGYNKRIRALEKTYEAEAEAIKRIDRGIEEQTRKVLRFKDQELAAIYKNRQEAIDSINLQIKAAEGLRLKLLAAYNTAKKIKISSSAPSGGGTSAPVAKNFAGGSIAAGTKSWVNELGKEAFLSASGKLSMIKATHGQWTAPTDGTIIPAHLTKQLDVPTGGVNLNKAAGMASSGGMNMGRMVKGITSAMAGGGQVINNVTIQSSNPDKTANGVLVELAKLKRLRYN